ncbi:hypothetical protein ACI8AA_01715 [Geodermatophilus sp. SYSU D01180]
MPVIERRAQSLADTVGIVEQWADDELVGSRGDGFGQVIGELTAGGG